MIPFDEIGRLDSQEIAQNSAPTDSERLIRVHTFLREIAPESYPAYCRAAEAEKLTLEAWLIRAADEKASRATQEP